MAEQRALVSIEARFDDEIRFWREQNRFMERICSHLIEDLDVWKTRLLRFYETEYHPRVGVLHEELDRMKVAFLRGRHPDLVEDDAAGEPRSRVELPADKERVAKLPEDDEKELKRLYRALVKRFHPDTARGASERGRRHTIMTAVNEAYREKDLGRLKACLDRAERDELKAGGSGREKVDALRAENEILRAMRAQLREEMGGLRETETYKLWDQVRRGREAGEDVLAAMAAKVREVLGGYARLFEQAPASSPAAESGEHWLYRRY